MAILEVLAYSPSGVTITELAAKAGVTYGTAQAWIKALHQSWLPENIRRKTVYISSYALSLHFWVPRYSLGIEPDAVKPKTNKTVYMAEYKDRKLREKLSAAKVKSKKG